MSQGLTTLRKRLVELRGAGSRLGRGLRAAALDLDANGAPFSAAVIHDLRSYRRDVEELRVRTLEAVAETVPTDAMPKSATFGELSAILRRSEEEIRRRDKARLARHEALVKLDRAEAIHCPDDPQFAPLFDRLHPR